MLSTHSVVTLVFGAKAPFLLFSQDGREFVKMRACIIITPAAEETSA